ncbi:MAG TPA: SCO family protein [Blastocatellia bacterium]|nr:SCO family protein [Blastocatellia bacterium]
MRSIQVFISTIVILFCSVAAFAQESGLPRGGPLQQGSAPGGKPKVLQDVGIEQRLNEQLPLDVTFRDETGREVRIGDYFGSKPVVLALVYYNCPMLCNQVLNGLVSSLRILSFDAGKEFNIVTLSFDARDTTELAMSKKEQYVKRYDRAGATEGWHFLTGDQQSIDRITEAVGFKYAFDPDTGQFAHASGIIVLTPQGKLARYFYGVEYYPKDLRFGLIEASENRIGNPVDQLLLYCYHYDPMTGKYGAVVLNIMRLAGLVTVVALVAFFIIMRRRDPARAGLRTGGAP